MFRKILIAVAGSEDESQTVPVVADLAKAFDSEVIVVHIRERVVTSVKTLEDESIPEAFAFGKQVSQRLAELGVKSTWDVSSARPDQLSRAVLRKADELEADLIVVGTHHAHGVRESIFGDIGKVLAHGAHCPVLLMPSPKKSR